MDSRPPFRSHRFLANAAVKCWRELWMPAADESLAPFRAADCHRSPARGVNLAGASGATWRKIASFGERTAKKCTNDQIDWTADLGDHIHAGDPQRGFELTADRATDHDIYTQLPQRGDSAVVFGVVNPTILDDAVFHLENTEMLRHVKDGGYATVPDR